MSMVIPKLFAIYSSKINRWLQPIKETNEISDAIWMDSIRIY